MKWDLTRGISRPLRCGRIVVPLLMLLAVAAGPASAQNSAQDPAHNKAQELLRQVAAQTAAVRTLHASFTQEKKLAILDAPLTSTGQLCLERSNDTVREQDKTGPRSERVIWAYEQPAVSGFAFEQGQGWLWTDAYTKRRPAQGMEATALKAVTEHILAWVRVRPEGLERLYTVQRLPDIPDLSEDTGPRSGSAASGGPEVCPRLRLVPKQSAAFFAALEVTFAPSLDRVRTLRFVEKNGDSTTLTFDRVRLNTPLPQSCWPQ